MESSLFQLQRSIARAKDGKMEIVAIILLVTFQVYALVCITKKMKVLEARVDYLEEHPNKLRKIPVALEQVPWTAVVLEDGTEICTYEKIVQLNSDAMTEYNKMIHLLGSIHATIYRKGTWLNTPRKNAASFRVSWYKDLNFVPKSASEELERVNEPLNTEL